MKIVSGSFLGLLRDSPFYIARLEKAFQITHLTIVLAETQVKKRRNIYGENRSNAGGQLWQM